MHRQRGADWKVPVRFFRRDQFDSTGARHFHFPSIGNAGLRHKKQAARKSRGNVQRKHVAPSHGVEPGITVPFWNSEVDKV